MDIPLNHFNFFDVFLLTVLFFSMIVGFARGFVREILSSCGWAGAIFLATKDFSFPKEFISQWIHDGVIAEVASRLGVFFLSLIAFLILAQLLSSFVQNSIAQSLDRSLGIVFGVLRGCLFIVAFYMGSLFFVLPEQQPLIVKSSKSIALLEKSVFILAPLLPESLKQKSHLKRSLEELFKQKIEHEKLLKQLSSPFAEDA